MIFLSTSLNKWFNIKNNPQIHGLCSQILQENDQH